VAERAIMEPIAVGGRSPHLVWIVGGFMLRRTLALLSFLIPLLACSLMAGTPTQIAPEAESTVVVGGITRLDAPPTRTPAPDSITPNTDPNAPTPLPSAGNGNGQAVSDYNPVGNLTGPIAAKVLSNLSNADCPVPSGWTTYTVQAGDSLFAIAFANRVDINTLQTTNCLINRSVIEIGQVLLVPVNASAAAAPTLDSARVLQAPATVDIYLVLEVPDGRIGGLAAGCGNMLVPIAQTVYGAPNGEARVRAALEALFALEGASVNEYRNRLADSALQVESVTIQDGIARVALRGEVSFAGVCDIPLVRGQIEQTVLDDDAVNQATITVNGMALDEVFSQQ